MSLLKQEYPTVFSVTNFYSQVEDVIENKTIHKGRISSEFVAHLVAQQKNVKESVHYICGPKSLKNTIQRSLMT